MNGILSSQRNKAIFYTSPLFIFFYFFFRRLRPVYFLFFLLFSIPSFLFSFLIFLSLFILFFWSFLFCNICWWYFSFAHDGIVNSKYKVCNFRSNVLLHVTKTDFYDLKDGCPEAPVLLFDFGYFGFNFSVFFYSRFFFTYLFLVIFFLCYDSPKKTGSSLSSVNEVISTRKKKIIRNYLLFWSFSLGCYNLVWSLIYRPFF